MIKRLDPGCPVQREAGRDLSSQRCRRPQTGLFSLAAQHSPSEAYIWATNGGRKLSGIGKLALRGEARLLGAMGTKSKSRSGATVGNAIKGRRHHRSRLQHVRYPLQHSIHPQLSWRDSTGGEPMPGSRKLYPNAAGISRIPGARHPRSQPPRTPRSKRAPPTGGRKTTAVLHISSVDSLPQMTTSSVVLFHSQVHSKPWPAGTTRWGLCWGVSSRRCRRNRCRPTNRALRVGRPSRRRKTGTGLCCSRCSGIHPLQSGWTSHRGW
jgi:hypothetical protein